MPGRLLKRVAVIAVLLAVPGCGESVDSDELVPADGPAEGDRPAPASGAWSPQASAQGAALALFSSEGERELQLFCRSAGPALTVNLPGVRPIGSEERLSIGAGGQVAALVADSRGDAERGGVTGEGPAPSNLAAMLAAGLSATYGNQTSGPHPPVPAALLQHFVSACGLKAAPAPASEPAQTPAPPTGAPPSSPCMVQDGVTLAVRPMRAVGTEPFWGARIEGRCVTYSHPEDQQGTRVWTRYAAGSDGGSWTGALGGKPFVLRTRVAPGCSDGMSDRRYPIAVELEVGGERRTGCAAPI